MGVAVVLGAGNQSFLTIVDTLDQTLKRRRPVILKHHPLRPWLAAPCEIILAPLISRGYLAQVADVGHQVTKALLSHKSVGYVHVTGSYHTAEIIKTTLQESRPGYSSDQIKSMVTSELGCSTPEIIDGGEYTEKELLHIAHLIAFSKKSNGGCNCLAAQAVVLPKNWPQKENFMEKLVSELGRQPTCPCYYPGSVERKATIAEMSENSKCTLVNAPSVSEETKVTDNDQVMIIECGTPGHEGYNSKPLVAEAFCPILAIVEMDGDEKDDDYLKKTVVPFLNNKDNIYGSLSCSIFTPKSKGELSSRKELQEVFASLQYTSICVNQVGMFGYLSAVQGGLWGGHFLEKRGQSGDGFIGDQFGLAENDFNAKAIVYGPSLEEKPQLDLAKPPPAIVMDILLELTCTPNIIRGVIGAVSLVASRTTLVALSYLPVVGRYFAT